MAISIVVIRHIMYVSYVLQSIIYIIKQLFDVIINFVQLNIIHNVTTQIQ